MRASGMLPLHIFITYIHIDAIFSCPCNFFLLVLVYSHYFLHIEIFTFYFGMCCDCRMLLPPIMRIINYCDCALNLFKIYSLLFIIYSSSFLSIVAISFSVLLFEYHTEILYFY